MHCELKITCDSTAELARVAAAVAGATGRDVEAETAADGVELAAQPGEQAHGGDEEVKALRKTVAHLQQKLQEQHEAHRDAVWEIKGILGASPTTGLKTAAEKVREALFSAVAEVRENKDALERAAAEHVRLRKRLSDLEVEHAGHRSLVVDLRAILGAAPDKSLREEARRVAGEHASLKAEIRIARDELGARSDESLCPAAHRVAEALTQELGGEARRRAVAEAREHGAAEMRERVAVLLDGIARNDVSGLCASLAKRIRGLPLTGAPAAAPDLSAEDAETLRAGAWRTLDDGRWVGPIAGAVFDARTAMGLRVLREKATELRTLKAPTVAQGAPGAAVAAPPDLTEPTATDAVAGMLLRHGYPATAHALLHEAITPAEIIGTLSRDPVSNDDRACLSALEALARGELRGARDHQDLLSAIERLTRERDEARGDAATLRVKSAKAPPAEDWTAIGPDGRRSPEFKRLRGIIEEILMKGDVRMSTGRILLALASEGLAPRAEKIAARWPIASTPACDGEPATSGGTSHPEALTSADGKIALIVRGGVEAREVAAACIELLGLSFPPGEENSASDAYACGVTDGERRAKANAAELATAWDAREQRMVSKANEADARGDDLYAERCRGRGGAVFLCVNEIRKAFGLGPTDPGKPPTVEHESENDARRTLVNAFAKSVISRAKERGVISNDQMHEMAGDIDRRLWPENYRGAPVVPGAPSAEERAAFEADKAGPFIPHEQVMAGVCERAHADGIVEGLRRAREAARRLSDGDRLGAVDVAAMVGAIVACRAGSVPVVAADVRPHGVSMTGPARAALLSLATGWKAKSTSLAGGHAAYGMGVCADELRRFLDEPAAAAAPVAPTASALAPGHAAPWRGLNYEVLPAFEQDVWIAQAIVCADKGEIYVSRFSGPAAEQRAREYAAWVSGRVEPASSHAAVAIPRLYPVTGPAQALAERIESVIAEVISEPSDGELRARPAALRVLRLVEEFVRGGVAEREASAPPASPWATALGREGRAFAAYGDPLSRRDGAIMTEASRLVRSEAEARLILSALGFAPGAADRVLSGEPVPGDATSPLSSTPSTASVAVTVPRLEVHGETWLVGDAGPGCGIESGPRGPERRVSLVCTAHLDGEHIACGGRAHGDPGRVVLHRWPIEPASPETPDPRWEPGAAWEFKAAPMDNITRLTICRIGDSGRHAVFDGGRWEACDDMTEQNGWRFVGRSEPGHGGGL